ncbi:hypothetical protein Sfum_2579 [Syntrophobacter fumaroxidans MPOB]|uniref:Uncharacterized protein n=1 Tax=Syntrophobacter fumaroxidans (strain DSM 10017 / MPOB) TaxID=335543 RepID=A0LLF5_SYNFM|nr:hypothetical protein Sfum_2579 [Syntrophobacter fumaroxidans MPOB]
MIRRVNARNHAAGMPENLHSTGALANRRARRTHDPSKQAFVRKKSSRCRISPGHRSEGPEPRFHRGLFEMDFFGERLIKQRPRIVPCWTAGLEPLF